MTNPPTTQQIADFLLELRLARREYNGAEANLQLVTTLTLKYDMNNIGDRLYERWRRATERRHEAVETLNRLQLKFAEMFEAGYSDMSDYQLADIAGRVKSA